VHEEIDIASPRGRLAVRLGEAIERRWPAEVQAIGVHGSLAHGDDHHGSDVNLLVVTYRAGAGPRPALRRVDGTLVDLEVVTAEEGLRRARELTSRWPLEADRYVTTRALRDPNGWFARLRDTHLARLAEWYETDAALVLLAEARLHAAMVTGLLSRTYFRNRADAVKRTGLAGADMTELGAVLKAQADDLTARGRPVDGPLSALFE